MGPFDEYLFGQGYVQPTGQAAGQQKRLAPLTPEEEQGMLSKIGEKALGGIGYVGSVLEKTLGGRAIRGALGGKPQELLSILPLSDTLGITDEADRVSGKELLGMGGNDDWGSTIAGIGAELALDPATYLTFGGAAIGRGGQIARKIKALPATTKGRVTTTLGDILQTSPHLQGAAEIAAGGAPQLAAHLAEPLGGVAGLGLPFMHPSILLGTGQSGANFMTGLGKVGSAINTGARYVPGAGHVLDAAGRGIDATGRYMNAWFEQPVLGATSHKGQAVGREASAIEATRNAALRDFKAESAMKLKAAGSDPSGASLRMAMEDLTPPLVGSAVPTELEVAAGHRLRTNAALAEAQDWGLNMGHLVDPEAGYAGRQTAQPKGWGGGRPTQPLSVTDPKQVAREDILRGIIGGTEQGMNRMSVDPMIYTGTPMTAAAYLRGAGYLPNPAAPEALTQSLGLVNMLRQRLPESGIPERLFPHHPLQDMETVGMRLNRQIAGARASHGLVAGDAIDLSAGALAPTGSRPLLDVLEKYGIGTETVIPGAAAGRGGQTTQARLLSERLGRTVTPADLHNFAVTPETYAELGRYNRGFTSPESLSPLMQAFDYLTNLTKTFQTAMWPGFHVRNVAGGQHQNWIKGQHEPGLDPITGFVKPILDAKKLVSGEVIPDANKIAEYAARNLTPEQATRELGKEMYSLGVGGHEAVQYTTGGGGTAGTTLDDILSQIPGMKPKTLGGAASQLASTRGAGWNPLATETFGPAVAGREVGNIAEGVNRGSLYISLRRQGYTAEEAAKNTIAAHFDYSAAHQTALEASWMKRLIPFYRYTRENIPFQIKQLMERPGGITGMEAKIANDLRQQGGFLPDYLGTGLALPLGGEQGEGGTQRYLTSLGLPPEQAFEMLKGGPGSAAKTMMAGLSNLNPILKAPIEYATGKQFFTGRDLEDLYTMTGNTASDQLLMNSPLGRAATTIRTLQDPRKWEDPYAIPLNLGTGLKLTDVEMEKQRNIAAREYLTEMLRGQPEVSKFSTLYVKPGMTLTPQEEELMRLNITLEKKAQEAAKQKKIRIGG